MSWLNALVRPEILALKPYQPAAWNPGFTRLHANEWPRRLLHDETEAGLNQYPEPQPQALVARLAHLYRVDESRIVIGRGSDELIDLLVRAFCRANRDALLVCPPTFGMYSVAAHIQGAAIVSIPLIAAEGFALDWQRVLQSCATNPVKLVFLCSPNNPTGNLLHESHVLAIVEELRGRALVVVDEAYIEFSSRPSLAAKLVEYPNLAILRTLSKAHGLAGARVGALIADPQVIGVIRKLIAPYAIPQLTLEAVLSLLSPLHLRDHSTRMRELQQERARMMAALRGLSCVRQVYPSEANFLLARFKDASWALASATKARLLVRDARSYAALEDGIRITVGAQEQNDRLLEAWR
ncbi:MAG: histidinol-phosphate transaminase [Proteobacteria bacterium]|nr:histidinol-phosphate transaminase [Pseudomonadota bacterium]